MGLYESLRIDASLQGMRFGTWTVLGATFLVRRSRKRNRYAVCRCHCGRVEVQLLGNIRSGKSKGCLSCRVAKVAKKKTRHGKSYTRIHNIWCGIVGRCSNPNIRCWKYYGGRGIEICDRWRVFENFYADMGEPPTSKHEIDRINPDGNYEPSNCRWATRVEQVRNRRNAIKVEYAGELRSIGEISEITGVRSPLIASRLRKGWPVNLAAETPTSISGRLARKKLLTPDNICR